jgi:hypothetical protein
MERWDRMMKWRIGVVEWWRDGEGGRLGFVGDVRDILEIGEIRGQLVEYSSEQSLTWALETLNLGVEI